MNSLRLAIFMLLSTVCFTVASGRSDLSLCLAANNVTNFTSPNHNPSAFDTLFYFSIQNLRFAAGAGPPRPVAVILPETLQQLRSAVLCCRAAGAAIRIRSGGHSYEGLSYTAARGTPFAVLDLMNLDRVAVNPMTRTAWVESGATLGQTYHAVAGASSSLAFSAGSCPTVGSGGHIAGGGFGLLSRKYGLAADNVLDAILVDADGRVLDREAMGEDVFWALRGGGGGTWGAVYAWNLRLVPVPDRLTVFVVSRPGSTRDVAKLVDTWQRVAPSLPDEFYLSAFVGGDAPESGGVGFSATFKGCYLGPKSDAISIMTRRFRDLGVSDADCREMSWIESVVFFSDLREGATVSDLTDRVLHAKNAFKAKSDYVRAPIAEEDLIRAFNLMDRQPRSYIIMDPYGGFMGRVGNGDLPFPHRAGNLYAIQYLIDWRNNGTGDYYVAWLRRFYEHMAPFVSRVPRAAYVNYLDLDLGTIGSEDGRETTSDQTAAARAWGEKYFLGNYDRLVQVKTVVDPCNVFSSAQSIPPLPGRCGKSVTAATAAATVEKRDDGGAVRSNIADVGDTVSQVPM